MASNKTGQSASTAIDVDAPRSAKRQRVWIPDAGGKLLPDEIHSKHPRSGGTNGVLPDRMNSNQRSGGTTGGVLPDLSSLNDNEKKELVNSLDEEGQSRFFVQYKAYFQSKFGSKYDSETISSLLAQAKLHYRGWNNNHANGTGVVNPRPQQQTHGGGNNNQAFGSDMQQPQPQPQPTGDRNTGRGRNNNSAFEDESSDDVDDDQGHGFRKKDLVLSSVPFMGQDLEVIAFFDNKKQSQTTMRKYYDKKMLIMIDDIDRKNSISVSNGKPEEAAHWKGLTDANKFPEFLLEVICGGEFVELEKNTTSRIYKVIEKFGGRGQYESRDGNFIFGCNDVNGVADDLFRSGHITKEMLGELRNIQSDANKKLFYFIDTVNHKIAFVYNYHGCHYSKTDPGKVARVLVNGYASERRRKYNK